MTDNTGVTTVQKYKEKISVIEARQFLTEQDGRELAEWTGGQLYIDPENGNPSNVKLTLTFTTSFGYYEVNVGEYVLKGPSGIFTSLTKDRFEETFEKVGK